MKIKTRPDDLGLFELLGLATFELTIWEKHFVGEITFEDQSWIKIWVTCASAQFWEFKVFSSETNHSYHIKTGSGALSKYWPTIENMAHGMIVVYEAITNEEHTE